MSTGKDYSGTSAESLFQIIGGCPTCTGERAHKYARAYACSSCGEPLAPDDVDYAPSAQGGGDLRRN